MSTRDREAVKRFVEDALSDKHKCKEKSSGAEDAEMGRCLENVGVVAGDSRDQKVRHNELDEFVCRVDTECCPSRRSPICRPAATKRCPTGFTSICIILTRRLVMINLGDNFSFRARSAAAIT